MRQCGVAVVSLASCIKIAVVGFGRCPESQPVVDGHDDRVLEEFGRHHHEDHEEAARRQVTPAHLMEKSHHNKRIELADK